MKLLFSILGVAALCHAGSTRVWLQNDYGDFEKGQARGLSLRSDGRLSVGPKVAELFDASSAYLWALARDSKGNLYTGGGPGARLFQISPDGSHKKIAEFDALEIHAITVDSQDRVYVATSPDGKIYRVSAAGKSEEFYNPKQKYIWGMVFGPQGDLFVATGDAGEVHRVDKNGKGSVFFTTGETHARSLAMDRKGNLIVGTDPGGLVIRVSAAGAGFVLYQMSKHEVTAVACAPDGSVYAAGVASSGFVAPAAAPQLSIGIAKPGMEVAAPLPRPFTSGGADVYRLPSGENAGPPEKVWTNSQATVYAIGFDSEGRALLGTGNKGSLYRVESASLWTNVASVASTQITALATAAGGAIYAATANSGKVYRFGPGLDTQGSLDSDVFDSNGFSRWGRIKAEGQGKIALFARSGNLDRPQKNWSEWAAVTSERAVSPPSRFLQWRAVLTGGAALDSVEAAYLPANVAPRIEEVESTPPNYKFPPAATGLPAVAPAASLVLPAMGKKAPAEPVGAPADPGISNMTFAKGWIGARWNASDDNGDTLLFAVEIRGVAEQEWKPLAGKIREKRVSFDSTAFPDGEYLLRVTASDSLSNVKEEALMARETGSPFLIDNTPPLIAGLSLVREAGGLRAKWHAGDALSVIRRAEYSVDGGEWAVVDPVGKLSDSLNLDYDLLLTGMANGEHTVAVRVTDACENTAIAKTLVR